uniref:Uncharacterized protein n=1 Tax=Ceratitis capitata TaxID=7213 RepID=W8B8B0_CERCA
MGFELAKTVVTNVQHENRHQAIYIVDLVRDDVVVVVVLTRTCVAQLISICHWALLIKRKEYERTGFNKAINAKPLDALYASKKAVHVNVSVNNGNQNVVKYNSNNINCISNNHDNNTDYFDMQQQQRQYLKEAGNNSSISSQRTTSKEFTPTHTPPNSAQHPPSKHKYQQVLSNS